MRKLEVGRRERLIDTEQRSLSVTLDLKNLPRKTRNYFKEVSEVENLATVSVLGF